MCKDFQELDHFDLTKIFASAKPKIMGFQFIKKRIMYIQELHMADSFCSCFRVFLVF